MNKYTSYRVDVRSNNNNTIDGGTGTDGGSGTNNPDDVFQNAGYSAVLRRYSDFLWLFERLHKEKSGAIIPPLPEKQAVARFSATFIEERRCNLERFLRRIAVHPELYDAACLDTFLRADDLTFHATKNAKGQNAENMMMSIAYPSANPTLSLAPAPKKDGIKKWFAETKTSISGELVRSPDDDLFLEIERYIDGLEKQMKNVSTQATNLVKKGKEIANGLFEFGLAFNILGQSEADNLGNALTKMGAAADELSGVSMEHAEKEMIEFEEPLRDYLKTIYAVKLALQRRHEKRLTYTTCLSEVNAKRANFAKLRATPGAEAKAYGAEMSLKRGEAAAEAARDGFATVSQRVLREVDRFKREKGDDMKRVVLDYITAQIEYNKKMENVWANLLPEMEKQIGTMDNVSGVQNDQGVPTNVVAENNAGAETAIEEEVQDLSQSMAQQQNINAPMYTRDLHQTQDMVGMQGSVQYRDNSGYPMPSM
jgi:sorting nexin-1/2